MTKRKLLLLLPSLCLVLLISLMFVGSPKVHAVAEAPGDPGNLKKTYGCAFSTLNSIYPADSAHHKISSTTSGTIDLFAESYWCGTSKNPPQNITYGNYVGPYCDSGGCHNPTKNIKVSVSGGSFSGDGAYDAGSSEDIGSIDTKGYYVGKNVGTVSLSVGCHTITVTFGVGASYGGQISSNSAQPATFTVCRTSTNTLPTGHFTSVTCTWNDTASKWVYHFTATYNDPDAQNDPSQPGYNPADGEITGTSGYVLSSSTSAASQNGPNGRWDLTKTVDIYAPMWPIKLIVHDIGETDGKPWKQVDATNAPPCGRITDVQCDTSNNFLITGYFIDDNAQNDPSQPGYNPANGEIKGVGGLTIFGGSANGTTHTWKVPRSGKGGATAAYWPMKLWVHDYKGGYIPNGSPASGLPTTPADDSDYVYVGSYDFPNTGSCALPTLSCGSFTAPTDMKVGKEVDFKPVVQISDGSAPAGGSFTNIKVTQGGTTYVNTTSGYTGSGTLYGDKKSFIPTTAANNYVFQWTFDSNGNDQPNTITCTYPGGTAGYAPFFKVLGGDVLAGLTTKNGNTCTPSANPSAAIIRGQNETSNWYGAGTQDAGFALGQIDQFSTSLDPSANLTSPKAYTAGLPSSLSFADTKLPGGITTATPNNGGGFTTYGYCADDYAADALARPGTKSAPASFDPTGLNGTYTTDSHDVQVNAGTINSSQRLSLVVKNHDVYISGPITAANADANSAPYFELLVTGGNIYVDGSVSNLYGLYSAEGDGTSTGIFASCATGLHAETTQYNNCSSSPLTILGALSAAAVHFDRSYGTLYGTAASGPTSSNPAETVQFTPSLWLGAARACDSDPSFCRPNNASAFDSVTGLSPIL